MVPVEIGGTLLELREILDALERPLRSEEPLNIDAAQRRSIDPMPERIGPNVTDGMRRGVGVAVCVAVEARDTLMRLRLRRSSVTLNCCCGKGVTSRRSPSSCFGLRISLNSRSKLSSVTSFPSRRRPDPDAS